LIHIFQGLSGNIVPEEGEVKPPLRGFSMVGLAAAVLVLVVGASIAVVEFVPVNFDQRSENRQNGTSSDLNTGHATGSDNPEIVVECQPGTELVLVTHERVE
jgi:hypothetical protein